MWDTIVPFLAFLFLTAGAMLLYDGFSTSDLTQTTKVIGGASFLSLIGGLMVPRQELVEMANRIQGISQ